MPEDNPGSCVGEDAKNVAEYIYDAFYSSAARARNQPARVELARLTVNQYNNVLADLVGNLRGHSPYDAPPGLKAKYITRRRKADQVHDDPPVEQVDPKIDFDFAAAGPLKGRIGPDEYLIFWHGSLLRTETGDYEFNLETSNGCAALAQRQRSPADRRLGSIGQGHRASRVDPPARGPEVSPPRRFCQGKE